MSEKKKEIVMSRETAWKLFEKTGDVNYYLMYKHFTEN